RTHERSLARVERLVELGADVLVAADLRGHEPFAAEPIEPGALVERAQLVLRLGAKVGGDVEAETQVVGAPRLLHGRDAQDRLVALAQDTIVQRLEIPLAVLLDKILGERLRIERLALLLADAATDLA